MTPNFTWVRADKAGAHARRSSQAGLRRLLIAGVACVLVSATGAGASIPGPVSTGRMAATGALTLARYYQTSTTLPNGSVLVAGGGSNAGVTDTAELYNPTTGTFRRLASPMARARQAHTATVLQDGKVLIVGGYSTDGVTKTAEVFDPATETFTAVGSMTTPRGDHTATLLPDGRVLVVGGNDETGSSLPSHTTNTAEVYDPVEEEFFPVEATMNERRGTHTATLLNDGRVLIAGGAWIDVFSIGVNTAEIFDPATETFTALPVMSSIRKSHTATLLRSGQVLLAGGMTNDGPPFAVATTADLFDPTTNTFSVATGRMTPRVVHTATLLPDGKVLLTGGQNGGPNLLVGFSNSAEVYDPETQLFQPVLGVMTDVRSIHAASALPDGRVLITGGCCTYPAPVVVKSADIFDPSDLVAVTGP